MSPHLLSCVSWLFGQAFDVLDVSDQMAIPCAGSSWSTPAGHRPGCQHSGSVPRRFKPSYAQLQRTQGSGRRARAPSALLPVQGKIFLFLHVGEKLKLLS
jgi:hypothetical protein